MARAIVQAHTARLGLPAAEGAAPPAADSLRRAAWACTMARAMASRGGSVMVGRRGTGLWSADQISTSAARP
ncbi:MAG: hypothetical protein KGL50_09035, partial [Burkholderiales bacterium]|nr:hypothetical protein [Burkholderiales bacterium]